MVADKFIRPLHILKVIIAQQYYEVSIIGPILQQRKLRPRKSA